METLFDVLSMIEIFMRNAEQLLKPRFYTSIIEMS